MFLTLLMDLISFLINNQNTLIVLGTGFQYVFLTLIAVVQLLNAQKTSKMNAGINKQLLWLKIKVSSMDVAMEHEFKNGYAKKRDEVKNNLIVDENFLNGKDEDQQKIEINLFKK